MIKAILKKAGLNEVKESGWLVSTGYMIYKGSFPVTGPVWPRGWVEV